MWFEARRRIEAGEELMFDYGTYYDWGSSEAAKAARRVSEDKLRPPARSDRVGRRRRPLALPGDLPWTLVR